MCITKTGQLMLYKETIAFSFQIETKHINTAAWADRRFVGSYTGRK